MKKIQLDLKVETAIGELAEEIKALPRNSLGNVGRVPEALQERILDALEESRLSPENLGSRVGINGVTVRAWVERRRKSKGGKKKFTELKVVAPIKSSESRSAITLELAGGARVHGLSLAELRELISVGGGAR
jgi:hypothetical protein